MKSHFCLRFFTDVKGKECHRARADAFFLVCSLLLFKTGMDAIILYLMEEYLILR